MNSAQRKGLLESESLSRLVLEAVEQMRSIPSRQSPKDMPIPEGMRPEMAKYADPETYGVMKIFGDIVAPLG